MGDLRDGLELLLKGHIKLNSQNKAHRQRKESRWGYLGSRVLQVLTLISTKQPASISTRMIGLSVVFLQDRLMGSNYLIGYG